MMIQLLDAGKRYNRDWIFQHINYSFSAKGRYAITGPNGSGKSTLLQALSGAISFNSGHCLFTLNGKSVAPEKIYTHISFCAPYLELVEEFTLTEFLTFHQTFKPFIKGFTVKDIIALIQLTGAADKRIGDFSSGMKQRAKLAQCIFSDTPVLLLDEPCTNLDANGITVYHQLIENYCADKLVMVSSNDITEYRFCKDIIDITRYK